MVATTKNSLEEKMCELFRGNGYKLIKFERDGISGAAVAIVQDTGTREMSVFKCGSKKRIVDELNGYNLLKPYLNGRLSSMQSVREISPNEMMIVFSFIKGNTFHRVVLEESISAEDVVRINSEILQTYCNLWTNTAQPYNGSCARDYNKRTQETLQYLKNLQIEGVKLSTFWDYPIKVDGKVYPSMREIEDILATICIKPMILVLAWGDGHPNNIMVDPDDKDWHCIDSEYVATDNIWKEPLIRYLFWWRSEATRNLKIPNIVGSDYLQINYRSGMPLVCFQMEKDGIQIARSMAEFAGDHNWEEQFKVLMAVYFWRRMMYQDHYGREDYLIPLLGEGIKSLFGDVVKLDNSLCPAGRAGMLTN